MDNFVPEEAKCYAFPLKVTNQFHYFPCMHIHFSQNNTWATLESHSEWNYSHLCIPFLKKPTDLDLQCLSLGMWIFINNLGSSNLIGWQLEMGVAS